MGWISERGHRLHFDENGQAHCPESHEEYQLSSGKVNKL
jgi:UDP-2-acetamido-3-amino-2,3-dideoxy-glucuronate N-acetyltransferase